MRRNFQRLALLTLIWTFVVVVLGAYVRLSHAGLGCPDWPVCYGQITWPVSETEQAAANEAFPDRPVEIPKAWKEQVHRFFAGALGLMILALGLMSNSGWRRALLVGAAAAAAAGIFAYRAGSAWAGPLSILSIALPLIAAIPRGGEWRSRLAAALLALVIFQAMLGMWTVTLLLKPIVVTAHLLGGMATLALLGALVFGGGQSRPVKPWLVRAARLGLVVVVLQIFLGGWTSSNYAALACPDFPTCGGAVWPEADYAEAFVLWREIGVDYEGGVLDHRARVAIHYAHRLGAYLVALVLIALGIGLMRNQRTRSLGIGVIAVLTIQIALGIWNVLGGLPLAVAAAHNGVAALLLLKLVLVNARLRAESPG